MVALQNKLPKIILYQILYRIPYIENIVLGQGVLVLLIVFILATLLKSYFLNLLLLYI